MEPLLLLPDLCHKSLGVGHELWDIWLGGWWDRSSWGKICLSGSICEFHVSTQTINSLQITLASTSDMSLMYEPLCILETTSRIAVYNIIVSNRHGKSVWFVRCLNTRCIKYRRRLETVYRKLIIRELRLEYLLTMVDAVAMAVRFAMVMPNGPASVGHTESLPGSFPCLMNAPILEFAQELFATIDVC